MAFEIKKIPAALAAFYRKHPVLSNIFFIFVASMLLCWGALIFLSAWTNHGEKTEVPDVKGLTYELAYDQLTAKGYHVEISDSVYDSSRMPGTVIESWPRAGATVKPNREIFLTISSFQPRTVLVDMPITNMDSRQAMSYLEETLGISHVRIVSVPSQYPDLVLSAKYNGKEVKPGTKIPVNGLVTLEVGTVPTVTEVEISPTSDIDDSSDAYDMTDY